MTNIVKQHKMRAMRSYLFFVLFGAALGMAAFWLPTAMNSGNFTLPPLGPFGVWPLAALPYLGLFAVLFFMVAGLYRLFKRKFALSFRDGACILIGLYLSLAISFLFAAVSVLKGNFML